MTPFRRLAITLMLLSLLPLRGGSHPALAGTDATLDLKPYLGSVVYVDFWASWCVPCRKSFPWLNAMQDKYGDKGLVILAVNVDSDGKAAEKFLVQTPAKFQVIYDPKGKIAGEYDLEGMPSTFIYDRDGKLAIQHLGFLEKEAAGLEAQVVALLEKRAAKPAEEAKDEHSK